MMTSWKIILLCAIYVAPSSVSQDLADGDIVYYEGDDTSEEIDHCTYYDNPDSICNHDNFLSMPSLTSMFSEAGVKQCCPEQFYRFHDHCKDRPTFSKFACGSPGEIPRLPEESKTVLCPSHCITKELNAGFNFTREGFQIIPENEEVEVTDYCVFYGCPESDKWQLQAEVCFCPKQSFVDQLNRRLPETWKRCCEKNFQMNLVPEPGNRYSIECPRLSDNEEVRSDRLNCPNFFQKWSIRQVNENEMEVEQMFKESRNISATTEGYCTGTSYSSPHIGVETFMMICSEKPCKGQQPCLRTCCNPDEIFVNASCLKLNETMSEAILRIKHLQDLNIDWSHLHKAWTNERICQSSEYERKPLLNPDKRCQDEFELSLSEEKKVILHKLHNGRKFNQDEFCLSVTEDFKLEAEVCRKKPSNMKFKFYPYVLIASSFCLLLTLVVYTAFPKLLNHYTRIMRHFTIAMMVAFVILSVNQLVSVGTYFLTLCKFFGFAQQYFFLVTFTLMTAMSIEIHFQIGGKPSTKRRYRMQIVCGYLFPLIVSVATLVTEYLAPRCSPFKPRFGEEHCFFSAKEAKGIWFYLPIGAMLIINSSMFISTVAALSRLDRDKRRLNLRSSDNRSETMEKFLMYLKLFIGMGFIWSFEIIAGLASDDIDESSWYVTDVINMMQGFYVFIIFVCKRNVFNMIVNKGRPSAVSGTNRTGRTTRTNVVGFRKLQKDVEGSEASGSLMSNSTQYTR